jgi:hypothetical protein
MYAAVMSGALARLLSVHHAPRDSGKQRASRRSGGDGLFVRRLVQSDGIQDATGRHGMMTAIVARMFVRMMLVFMRVVSLLVM